MGRKISSAFITVLAACACGSSALRAAELDPPVPLRSPSPALEPPAVPGTAVETREQRLDQILRAGRKAYQERNYQEARKYVELATYLAAEDERVRLLKARIALEEFKEDSDRPYNGLVKSYFEDAVQHYRRERYPEALESLAQALKLDPSHPQVRALKAKVKADYANAFAEKETLQAEALLKDGYVDAALERLEVVIQERPKYQPALLLKKRIWSASRRKESEAAEKALSKARKAEEANRYEDALKYYRDASRLDPGNGEAQKGAARMGSLVDPLPRKKRALEAAIESGEREKARAALAEVEKLSPTDPQLPVWRQKVEALGGSQASLEDSLAKADEAYNLGMASYRKDDFAEAKRFWNEALRWNPQHPQAKMNLERLAAAHPELAK